MAVVECVCINIKSLLWPLFLPLYIQSSQPLVLPIAKYHARGGKRGRPAATHPDTGLVYNEDGIVKNDAPEAIACSARQMKVYFTRNRVTR